MTILITGKPCTGKTSLINYLSSKGINTFKMDEYIHEIYQVDRIGYKLIKNQFGDSFINKQGVNRKALGEMVFNDHVAMEKLKSLIWPLIRQKIKSLKEENENIVIELGVYMVDPHYFEDLFDFVIEMKRKDSLIPQNEKIAFMEQYVDTPPFEPDFIINNCWTWQYVQTLVDALFKIIY